MRKVGLGFLLMALLSGCGESQTPLSHGLTAFRDGDQAGVAAAKEEAKEALKTAIQPGGDLCLMTMMDVEKYGTVAVLDKLDNPDFFRISEEARFAYALKLAGSHLKIEPGSFLSQAGLYKAGMGDKDSACAGKKNEMMAALMSAGPAASAANEARMSVMVNWMRAMKAKHGTAYAEQMRSAVASLSNTGYGAPWPPKIDFIEPS